MTIHHFEEQAKATRESGAAAGTWPQVGEELPNGWICLGVVANTRPREPRYFVLACALTRQDHPFATWEISLATHATVSGDYFADIVTAVEALKACGNR